MRTGKLTTSILSAWAMGLTYDWINRLTGHEIRVLLYAGIVTLVVGLYIGLYAKNNETKKEES